MTATSEIITRDQQEAPFQPLDHTHRCDYCTARALYRVILKNGQLLFCRHDFFVHQEALDAAALRIEDHSHLLES